MKVKAYLQAFLAFLDEEDGPTAVEYAVMLALIAGVCISSVGFLADQTAQSFDTSANAISSALGN